MRVDVSGSQWRKVERSESINIERGSRTGKKGNRARDSEEGGKRRLAACACWCVRELDRLEVFKAGILYPSLPGSGSGLSLRF